MTLAGYAHRIHTLVMLPQSEPAVSFAPADLAPKTCAHCGRTFTPSNTLQQCCDFACASGGSHVGNP